MRATKEVLGILIKLIIKSNWYKVKFYRNNVKFINLISCTIFFQLSLSLNVRSFRLIISIYQINNPMKHNYLEQALVASGSSW